MNDRTDDTPKEGPVPLMGGPSISDDEMPGVTPPQDDQRPHTGRNDEVWDPVEWLVAERKIDRDLLHAMRVTGKRHPRIGMAAAFPYVRDGKPYAAKYRSREKDWASSTGISRSMYNEDDLRRMPGEPIVITEGEIDTLSTMTVGWERSTSIPDGWGKGETSRAALVSMEEHFRDSPHVVVAGDADKAGESLPRAVASLLRGHDVREARYPDGCKDPNDVLRIHGVDALNDCLANARRIDPPGGMITGISDLPPMSDRRVLRTGLIPFDNVVALEVGAMSMWTGIPGSGKSTFLTFAADMVVRNEGVRCGVMAFETHPYTLRNQLCLLNEGVSWDALPSIAQRELAARLDRSWRVVHRTEDDTVHRIDWLVDMIHTLAVRDGCKLIVVDPWNELEHIPAQGEPMTAYANWALGEIRRAARTFECHVALVAHPKKMDEGGRAPTGYDIADSAAFFNKPALGCTVHQRSDDAGNHYVELICWKVRETLLYGIKKGRERLSFDEAQQRYAGFIADDGPIMDGRGWE
jgi:twinkle protein